MIVAPAVPADDSGTGAPKAVPLSRNCTVPEGRAGADAVAATVAVKVTGCPGPVAGDEAARVVMVAWRSTSIVVAVDGTAA